MSLLFAAFRSRVDPFSQGQIDNGRGGGRRPRYLDSSGSDSATSSQMFMSATALISSSSFSGTLLAPSASQRTQSLDSSLIPRWLTFESVRGIACRKVAVQSHSLSMLIENSKDALRVGGWFLGLRHRYSF